MTPLMQLGDASTFERAVWRTAVLAAVLGAVHALVWLEGGQYLPTWFIAPPAALLAYAVSTSTGRWPYALGAAYALTFMVLLQMPAPWGPGFIGAAAGVGICVLRRIERSRQGAAVLPGAPQFATAAAAGAGLTLIADGVGQALFSRLLLLAAPAPLPSVIACAAAGLIVSLCAAGPHLSMRQDPVLSFGDAVLPQLRGRFLSLAERALGLYRESAEVLAQLPPDGSRAELSRTLVQLGKGALAHAAEWSGAEAQLASAEAQCHAAEAKRLREEVANTEDVVALAHLRLALCAHEEESERLQALQTERVRALARLEAEVALLARARGALAGMRSGQVQLRSAELAALSRKLTALSQAQAVEAQVIAEVARGAELDQLAVR